MGAVRRPRMLPLLLLALAAAAPPTSAQLLALLAGSPAPGALPEPAAPAAVAAPSPTAEPAPAPRRPAISSDPVLAQRIARANGTAVICISPQPAQVDCSIDDLAGEASGYQVDLFRHASLIADLGIKEGGYVWRCIDWQPMIDDLASPTGECYMAPGVDVLSKYIKQGIRFTWPTLTQGEQPHRPDPPLPAQNWLLKGGGLKILTIGSMQAQGIWSMFGAFHWGVWLALFLTILCVGLLLGLFNRCSKIVSAITLEEEKAAGNDGANATETPHVSARGDAVLVMPVTAVNAGRPTKPSKPYSMRRLLRHQLGLRRGQRMAFVGHMGDHVWQALAVATTMSEGGIDPPRSLPGRILYATFLFLLLVMLSMFTANTAGIITSLHLNSAINSRSDLAGKAVGVWEGYAPLLQTTEIAAVQLPWENNDDLDAMMKMLYGGSIKALLVDASAADHIAAFNGSCKVRVVGEPIQEWGSGFAFPANTSDATLEAWNAALLSIQQNSNMMDTLKAKYLGTELGDCDRTASTNVYQLRFGQVAGLWVILAIAAAMACVVLFVLYLARHHASMRKLALASLGDGDGNSKGGGLRRGWSAMRSSFARGHTDRAAAARATAAGAVLAVHMAHHSQGSGEGLAYPDIRN